MKMLMLVLSWLLVIGTMATAVPNPDEVPTEVEVKPPPRPPEEVLTKETGGANPDTRKAYLVELKTELMSWDRRIQEQKARSPQNAPAKRRVSRMELVRDELRADVKKLEKGDEGDWKIMRPAIDAKLNSLRHTDQQVGSAE